MTETNVSICNTLHFILKMSFYHFLSPTTAQMVYYYSVSFFIVSLDLKVKVKVILIVMIIGSHGERKVGTCYMPGII